LLKGASESRKAVFAFNVQSFDAVAIMHEYSARTGRPLIMQTSTPVARRFGPRRLAGFLKALDDVVLAQVYLTLDHCPDMALILSCIAAGYDSVMADHSALPLEKNIEKTGQVVRAAHERNCLVEGEVGTLKGLEDGMGSDNHFLTDACDAARFVSESGVDLFAPAFGNVHGKYSTLGHRLDFGILKAVSEAVEVPLVLHGGTGLTHEEVSRCIGLGVSKVNVSTAIKEASTAAFKKHANVATEVSGPSGMLDFIDNLVIEYSDVLDKYLDEQNLSGH
jgi:ketose-bisphosphate aldolase